LGPNGAAIVHALHGFLDLENKPTLADLAEHKGLSVEYLASLGLHNLPGGGVGIPYYDNAGKTVALKQRTHLAARLGSRWPAGQPVCAYGEHRLALSTAAGYLILTEGESNCWALWFHGVPALGMPGAKTVKKTLAPGHVRTVSKIYLVQDPDKSGQDFVEDARERLAGLGWQGQLYVVKLRDVKDPSDLHKQDPAAFRDHFQAALDQAEPVDIPAVAEPGTWEEPIPFRDYPVPDLPLDALPGFLVNSVNALAESTQTPPDLAALLILSICGAALAKRFRVCIREGWSEPTNLLTVVALPPGERKSAVFDWVMAPVRAHEEEETARMEPLIAEEATKHRMLEARLRNVEGKAAKAEAPRPSQTADANRDEHGESKANTEGQ
jgi:hypothetical protein